jgi:hypothetical protein
MALLYLDAEWTELNPQTGIKLHRRGQCLQNEVFLGRGTDAFGRLRLVIAFRGSFLAKSEYPLNTLGKAQSTGMK